MMTLPTHTAAGLLTASFLPPGIAQVAAFLSHFVLDLIPHWEKDKWLKNNKELLRISFLEIIIAFSYAYYISGHNIQYMSAAVLSCLPDINHLPLIGKKLISILPIRWVDDIHHACHFWQRQKLSQGNNGPPIFQFLFTFFVIVVINVNS